MFKTFRTWLMLFWAIAWFGFIVPGHTRGIVQLAPDPFAKSSCHAQAGQPSADEAPMHDCCMTKPKPASSKDNRPAPFMGKCALCDMAAKSVTPDHFQFTLPFVGLISLLEPPKVFTLSGVQFLIDLHSRGPPQAA